MLRMSIWRDMTSRLFPTGLPAATACMSDAFQSVYRKKQQRAERISAASPISLQNHRHMGAPYPFVCGQPHSRSEEHTSELQSLMRISYAVFCLKKKTKHQTQINHITYIMLSIRSTPAFYKL